MTGVQTCALPICSEEWIPQVVVGLELPIKYNEEDTLYVGAEYFHNEAGYENSSLLPWMIYNGGYRPLYLGRDYAAAYLLLATPGRLDHTSFSLSGLGNLSDSSYQTRFQVQTQLRSWIDVDAFAGWHFGKNGELHYSYSVPAIPSVTEGLDIPAPQIGRAHV